MTVEKESMDREILAAEHNISVRAISEQLWGGRRGPGIIYAVAETNKTAVDLAKIVTSLSEDIHRDGGIQTTMRGITAELKEIRRVQEDTKKAMSRVILFLAVIGLATLFAQGGLLFRILAENPK
jgi:hypothetical protein